MNSEQGTYGAAATPQRAGEKVHQSTTFRWLVTLGLLCFGLIHLLLGWLCIQVALGGQGETSTQGALKDLVAKPFGNVLMIIIAAGLFALVVWQVVEGLFGYRRLKQSLQVRRKLASAGRAIVYAALGISALALAVSGNSGSSDDSARSASATLMAAPFGQVLVGLVGLGIGAVGISHVVKGARRRFVEEELAVGVAEWAKKLGTVGWIVKGIALGLVGLLFIWAAVTFDPQKAAGLDGALKALQQQPFGVVLLTLMGLGFACFGVYCLVWSRNVNFENV